MKGRRGVLLLCTGLLLGLGVGLGYRALQQLIIHELTDVLKDEVAKSCDCTFEVDSMHISLVTLTGEARNPRIIENGETRLQFKKLLGSFSLGNVLNRRVTISELRLIDGFARGVGDDSATFRFIDHLSEPLPPEKDYPGRWKVELDRLTVEGASFTEALGSVTLLGEGAEMVMTRNPADNFELVPRIKLLKLHLKNRLHPERSRDMVLGEVTGKLEIREPVIDFKQVQLALGKTLFTLAGISHTRESNRLEGTFNLQASNEDYQLIDGLDALLRGSGIVRGSLGRPILEGSAQAIPQTPVTQKVGNTGVLSFDSGGADFRVDASVRPPVLHVPSMRMSSEQNEATIETPLRIADEALSGEMHVSAKFIEILPLTVLHDVDALVALGGPLESPTLTVSGEAQSLTFIEENLGPVTFDVLKREAALDLTMNQRQAHGGTLSLSGSIVEMDSAEPRFKNFVGKATRYAPPFITTPRNDDGAPAFAVSGAVTIEGPVDPRRMTARGDLAVMLPRLSNTVELRSRVSVEKGDLSLTLTDQARSVDGAITIPMLDDRDAEGKLVFTRLHTEKMDDVLPCVHLDATLDYRFTRAGPRTGDGSLAIQSFSLGCNPYSLSLNKSVTLAVREGRLDVGSQTFQNGPSNFNVAGTVSFEKGYDLSVTSKLDLAAFLSFLPSLDDLHGRIQANLAIGGPFNDPRVTGGAELHETLFATESAGVAGSNITGGIDIAADRIAIRKLTGTLNGGTFSVAGVYLPQSRKESEINLTFHDVLLEPEENLSVVLSGDLELIRTDTDLPLVKGAVTITSGELRRQIDMVTLLKALRSALFSRSQQVLADRAAGGPDLLLDVSLSIPGNVVVLTNWAAAELKGDLHIQGTAAQPQISGTIESVSGWFGLKDRRFQITSGQLIFSPNESVPRLALLSETNVRTHLGENVFMILEAKGPIDAPKLFLSSDSGFSERELLNLFTTGRTSSRVYGATHDSSTLELEETPLLTKASLSQFGDFLQNLTRLDILSVQPTYNERTGSVEPILTAQKKLTDTVSLYAQNSFASGTSESRAGTIIELTPKLDLIGSLETLSTQQNTALGVDLAYTILSSQQPFVTISFKGNRKFDDATLLRGLRVSASSRLREEDTRRLTRELIRYYHRQGYFEARADATCVERQGFCRQMSVSIHEGPESLVSGIESTGEPLPAFVSADLLDPGSSQIASKEFADERRDQLISVLRNEGYIGARIESAYSAHSDTSDRTLVLKTILGKPVSFVFRGNSRFSNEELLDTINLFGRRQPFGSNTIHILIDNIERLYREAGFLYTTLSFSQVDDPSTGRIIYTVEIREEAEVPVVAVTLTGNAHLSQQRIVELLREQDQVLADRFLSPSYAIAEEIENISSIIKDLYIEQGYPDIKVDYQILPDAQGKGVEIQYLFREGDPALEHWVRFEGIPADVTAPQPPEEPYSIPAANRLILKLIQAMRNQGYLSPQITTFTEPQGRTVVCMISAHEKTIVEAIEIEGLVQIDQSVVLRNFLIAPGSPWSEAEIDESRRRLLRTGLFSQVEALPSDGDLDTSREKLVVRLVERPLQTLSIGSGLNSEYGLHFFGEAVDKGFFKDGRSLSLRFDTYYDRAAADISQGVANARYTDPSFFDSNYVLTEDIRYQKLDTSTQEFDIARLALASGIHRSWDNGMTFSFGHTILGEDLTNVSPGAIISPLDEGHNRLSFLSGVFAYDKRNNPLIPTDGYALSFDYKLSAQPLGSQADFHALGAEGSVLSPLTALSPRMTLALGSRVASAWVFGETSEVPISQRFYLGGRSTVRGFRENSLGPRGDDGAVIGGDLLLSSSAELQYLLYDALSVHVFLDAGTVYLQDRGVDLGDIRSGTGVGFRFISPIGPIGLDVARPVDEETGEPSVRVHFNVGSNF